MSSDRISKTLYDIEIFNIFGQAVMPQIKLAKNISVMELTDGLYFIRSKNCTVKFVVTHSGKDETLNCDINEGLYSSALPHMANISYRLGCELKFMGGEYDYEKFVNDPEADALLTRIYRPPYVVPNQV
jgi:hypothetical protein